jgi:hypothetical protein
MIKKIALAASLALFGTAAQADTSNVVDTFNIAIDGHCNTFTVNIDKQLVAGTRGGCGSAIEGGTVAKVDHQRGVIISETTRNMVVTWYFETPEAGTGRVFVYGSDGTTNTRLGAANYHIVHNTPAEGSQGSDMLSALHAQ